MHAPKFEYLLCTRVVTTEKSADSLLPPPNTLLIRTAFDELLIIPSTDIEIDDPHAIIVHDDASYAGCWLDMDTALNFLSYTCEWELPTERPAFAQGAVAGIATKLHFEQNRVLFIVGSHVAHEMAEHMEGIH